MAEYHRHPETGEIWEVDDETAAAIRHLQHIDLPPLDGPPQPPEPPPAVQAAKLREAAALLREHADADYVTLMSPVLGAVLADWLDVKAANLECVTTCNTHPDPDYGYALAVARAILGDETEG